MAEFDPIAELPLVTVPEKIYAVSEITECVKGILEETIGTVWVEGEISNYKHHTSGHRYFSLKDEAASLRCVMWRQVGGSLTFDPADGLRVRAHGRITVYPPQGSYQLVVSRLVPVGVGPLEIAFQKLKEKLLREGLFDEARKRPIPEFPNVVGVVTSATGAAFVDITETIADRFPGLRIVLAPVRVQGDGAAEQIVAALAALNRRDDIDVIIAGRGGGSLEDLWAFNEEIVARAIAASRIPVISAVGHEVDFTIADGVADLRAATPTAAAQIVTDGWVGAAADLPVLTRRLTRAQAEMLRSLIVHLDRLRMSHALRRPADMLERWSQRLDETGDRMQLAAKTLLRARQEKIVALEGHLSALSPEAVLGRGYSITRRRGETAPLRQAAAVSAGDQLETRLAEGTIIARVEETTD